MIFYERGLTMSKVNKHNGVPSAVTIEELVSANGNWMVVYCYNRFGNNIMMLLPNFDNPEDGYDVMEINTACTEVATYCYEESRLVDQYMRKHPDHPFLIMERTMIECTQKLCELLAGYHDDLEKFIRDSDEFDRWRRAVHKIHNTDGAEITAEYEGWEKFAPDAE